MCLSLETSKCHLPHKRNLEKLCIYTHDLSLRAGLIGALASLFCSLLKELYLQISRSTKPTPVSRILSKTERAMRVELSVCPAADKPQHKLESQDSKRRTWPTPAPTPVSWCQEERGKAKPRWWLQQRVSVLLLVERYRGREGRTQPFPCDRPASPA